MRAPNCWGGIIGRHGRWGDLGSVSERVNRDVQGKLLSIVGADTFSFVATIFGAESAAEPILTHDRHEVAFVEKTFQLDIACFIQATHPFDLVERTINDVIVRNRFHFFA